MPRQIVSISIHQASKIMAIMYGLIGLVFIPILWLSFLAKPDVPVGLASLLLPFLFPVLYAVLGYLFTAVMCWLYNQVARRIGGIEIVLADIVGSPSR